MATMVRHGGGPCNSDRLSLEATSCNITGETGDIPDLKDRGRPEPGFAGDVGAFDCEVIDRALLPVWDVPGGGSRNRRSAIWADAVPVKGGVTVTGMIYIEARACRIVSSHTAETA